MGIGKAKELSEMLARRPLSLVVVDDDEKYRNIISELLVELGFIVSGFSEASEMMDIYCQFRFDIIILQWEFEEMTGVVAMDEMYRIGKPLPSVIVSCEGGKSVSITAPFSPSAFLFKPFNSEKLIDMLLEVIGDRNEYP